MTILHVITSLDTGGAERLIVDAIPVYQKKQVVSDVVILRDRKTEFRTKLEERSNGKVTGLTEGSVYNPLLIFKIVPFLKYYDIVHVHLFPALYWVVLAKLFSGQKCKIIYTEHSTYNKRRDLYVIKLFDRWIYSFVDYIGCISKATFDNLNKHLYPHNSNLTTIYNGINLSEFTQKERTREYSFFEKESFVLLQVSSFREQKDQATVIRALSLLPEEVKLLLVGDGPLRKINEDLAKELHIENRVKFLGNRTDVADLQRYADVCVLSSNHEGFGLAVLEGMATGKPSIASDIPGLSEIVKGYGLLFRKGDFEELANLIQQLRNPEFYDEVASKCLNRSKAFSIEAMVDHYIALYKKANEE